MGLFSFLKNAGAKLFNKKSKATKEEIRETNINNMKQSIADLGFEVRDLYLDLQDDTVIVFGEVDTQEIKEKVILTVGNVEGIATVDDRLTVSKEEEEPVAQFYEVVSGDSLSKIAKKYYGDAMKYPVIFEANKPMLKDPNLIYPGQMLRIPAIEEKA